MCVAIGSSLINLTTYRLLKTFINEGQQKIFAIKDSKGCLFSDDKAVLGRRWTENCNDLYSFQLITVPNILQDDQETNADPEDL